MPRRPALDTIVDRALSFARDYARDRGLTLHDAACEAEEHLWHDWCLWSAESRWTPAVRPFRDFRDELFDAIDSEPTRAGNGA